LTFIENELVYFIVDLGLRQLFQCSANFSSLISYAH